MNNGHRWGFIIIAILLSLLTTRGGLLNQSVAPLLIGIAIYEMFPPQNSRWIAILLTIIMALAYQYTMQLLAGGLPRLY